MEIAIYIAHFSTISILIPLSFAIIQWRKLPTDISPLRWLLIVSLISDITEIVLAKMGQYNLVVGIIYLFVQFTFLLYIFSLQFENKKVWKLVWIGLVSAYVAGLFISIETLTTLSTATVNLEAFTFLILIIVPIMFFYKLLSELKVMNIHRLPILWICFATLFYYSGNLFLFLARDLLAQVPESYGLSWILHNILNVTKNILFAVALWQSYRTMKSSK